MSARTFAKNRLESLRTLRVSVAATAIIAVGTTAASVYLSRSVAAGNRVLSEIAALSNDSTRIYALGLQMGQATRNILLDPSNGQAYRNHAAAARDFSERLESVHARVLQQFPGSSDDGLLTEVEADFRKHLGVQARVHTLAKAGQLDAGKQVINAEDTPLWRKYKALLLRFDEGLAGRAELLDGQIRRRSRLAETLSWVSGAALILIALISLFITQKTSGVLRFTVAELTSSAGHVATAAAHVAGSSQSLSHGASEQAASIEETSASMEEVASMTRRNAESSKEAAQLMVDVGTSVSQSNEALAAMVGSMEAIQESSNQVGRIIKTIDEIAFQTNILALNAAVEAARAGESGMGFAVVADEVRSLAQRSAQAAKDTTGLIEQSIARSAEGGRKVELVAQSIQSVGSSVSRVQALVEEVSVASQQQAQGLEQVAQAVAQVEKVTQAAAATAEESAAAGGELNGQAERAMAVVARLQQLVGGADGPASRREAATVSAESRVVPIAPPRKAAPRTAASAPDGQTGTYGSF